MAILEIATTYLDYVEKVIKFSCVNHQNSAMKQTNCKQFRIWKFLLLPHPLPDATNANEAISLNHTQSWSAPANPQVSKCKDSINNTCFS